MCKRSHSKKTKDNPSRIPTEISDHPNSIIDNKVLNGSPGQYFHMDFGFFIVSEYSIKQENAPTVTSIDGYNSDLIIVDRVTMNMWIFLTSSKIPPINIAKKVLNKFKCSNKHRTVRTYQEKELGRSQ